MADQKTSLIEKAFGGPKPTETPTVARKDENELIQVLKFKSARHVEVGKMASPVITDQRDAVVRVTATSICGSDLHLYHNVIPETLRGDVLGHEAVGIVEKVGANVQNIKVGQRVVISAVIACGQCDYCKEERYSLCDSTNSSETMNKMFGGATAGLFGYSHMTGGYCGLQTDGPVRVPFADVNLFPLDDSISDDIGVLLSDVLCTSWHGNELGEVSQGDNVAIWGAGPIGLMAGRWAKYRGARRVILIDNVIARLDVAKSLGFETVDFSHTDVVKALKLSFDGAGPDVCMECAGFRYSKSYVHMIEKMLRLETDSPDALAECIYAVKKGGRVVVIGDFIGYANHFPVGALMEKAITLRGGQLWAQKYIPHLMEIVRSGKVDPSFLITHIVPFELADKAYELFDKKLDGVIKIVLMTTAGTNRGKFSLMGKAKVIKTEDEMDKLLQKGGGIFGLGRSED